LVAHPAIKIVISGPVASGKTTFVRTVSETEIINTDEISSEALEKRMTTVAFDFGTRRIHDYTIYLFGTPGQERFDYMWNILCNGALGLLLLVNGTRFQDFPRARNILDYIVSQINIPFIVGVTHQDVCKSWDPHDVAMYFRLPSQLVVALDARDEKSSLNVLLQLFQIINLRMDKSSKTASSVEI
jgi:small GTP-binding protein